MAMDCVIKLKFTKNKDQRIKRRLQSGKIEIYINIYIYIWVRIYELCDQNLKVKVIDKRRPIHPLS